MAHTSEEKEILTSLFTTESEGLAEIQLIRLTNRAYGTCVVCFETYQKALDRLPAMGLDAVKRYLTERFNLLNRKDLKDLLVY